MPFDSFSYDLICTIIGKFIKLASIKFEICLELRVLITDDISLYAFVHRVFPGWLCPVMQFSQLYSVFITSITLTIIGVERYMATLHPFSRAHQWLRSHTATLLLLTWITGAAYAFIPLTHTRISEFTVNGTVHLACTADNDMAEFKRRLFMNFNFILTFLVPSLTLTVSYAAILKRMKRQKQINNYLNDCQILNQVVFTFGHKTEKAQ